MKGDQDCEPSSHISTGKVKCSWCELPAIQYLMHQAFCKDCGTKFCELHKGFCK